MNNVRKTVGDNIVAIPEAMEGLEIESYFHCAKCMDEKPDDMSPREYGSVEVGFTNRGLQVWCKRHEMNVVRYNLTDIWNTLDLLNPDLIFGRDRSF